MHYYKFNIADYRKDTAHLSPVEHYIYRTLIDTYYLDENPLGYESVIRRLRLSTEQVKDLDNVLNDFFIEHDDGWHHVKIDLIIKEYAAMSTKNKANGSKGGRPSKPTGLNMGSHTKPTGNPNHKPLTINHIKKSKPKKETQKRFIKPTIWQVTEYCQQRKNNVDHEKWIDYYTSNGWKVGKNPMKDWKAAVRTWERNDGNSTGKKTASGNEQKAGYSDRLASLDL